MKKFAAAFFIFLPFFLSAQMSNHSVSLTTDKFVLVEGHKTHYQTAGLGNATVVFENGHGDNMSAWDNIYIPVARFAKVIRYDREGYGLSDTNSQPTSFKQIAARLHELLQKANTHPPYVLVGHSLGGALIRAYADLYPDEVAGFVFVDPLTEYMGNELSKEEKLKEVLSFDSMMVDGSHTYVAEWQIMRREFLDGFPEINSYALPDVPIVLFAAGRNRPPNWEKSVRDLFENKMKNLSESRIIEIPRSPHYVQDFEPPLVIENIRRVVFPDAENVLRKTLSAKGADSCIAQYKRIELTYPKEYILERFLNTLGYEELRRGQVEEAIKLFKLNVQRYPQSSNVYDSLGEAYMNAGNKKEAVVNYKKSLALDPANTNAEKMLKKLN
jgi:pimeloyl-ACP methyl ester carboxylesterase